jgi:hypothetical protein
MTEKYDRLTEAYTGERTTSDSLLGALEKLRKATITFVVSCHLFSRNCCFPALKSYESITICVTAQAFILRPLTAVGRHQCQANPCEIMVEKVSLGQFFHLVLRLSLSVSFKNDPYSFIYHRCYIISATDVLK